MNMAMAIAFLCCWMISGAAALGDPCLSGKHRHLKDIRRSTGFQTAFPELPLCDRDLKPGWYRFNNETGGKMPETCVNKTRCGTVVPIWLDGAHPSQADGIVERKACANFDSGDPQGSSCCRHSVTVGVKNCGGFYVYLLHPTPSCPMAYCAGSRAPCPVGQWSASGFPPGCQPAYPMMTTPPQLKGPIVEDKTFHFRCEIQFPSDGVTEPGLEVRWTFDGNATNNVTPRVLNSTERVAILEGYLLKGHLGKHVGCEVRSFFPAMPSRTSPWLQSNTYWAGIRTQPSHLIISQSAEDRNVTLTSTVPILCDHDLDCCLSIKLDIDGPQNKVVTPHQCKKPLCKEGWGKSIPDASIMTIPLVASKDQIQDGTSHLLLSFEELISVGGGMYQDIFTHYVLDPVQIEIEKDPAEICTLVTDPHITSIDTDRTFNLYRVGDYTAYQSPSRHFEVQIRTWPCNGDRVTCICGVAVREKDDLIRIQGCDKAYYSRNLGAPDVQVPRKLREGTSVMQSTDGHEIGVYFPSGSEVTVKAYSNYGGHFNLHIAIPSIDKGKGQGLCGTFDGDDTNDFTHRDGTVDRSCPSYCTPETFTESWKNGHSTSLFRIVPPALNEEYTTAYCQCGTNVTSQINCTARGDIQKPVIPCAGDCQEKQFGFLDNQWHENRRRSADGAVYADTDEISVTFDPDNYQEFVPATPHWPTPSGITQSMAETKCREALQGSQLWKHCQGQTEHANNNIDNCKEDILFGDSFDSLQSLVDSFTSNCQAELAKDPDNYVTNAEGESVIKPEISTDVCSGVCLQHGHCDRGRCVCDAGYTGATCQLRAGQGPQLLGIRGSHFCDINARPCRKVFFDADNMEMTETLGCKVEEILPDGRVSAEASLEEAVFVSGIKLMCSLPDARLKSDRSVKMFRISATMDGTLYGNALNMTVYDSVCQNCSSAGCVKLPDTCLIKELCFTDGDNNPEKEGQVCEIASSTEQWTNLYPQMSPPLLTGPDSEGAVICSVDTPDIQATSGARYLVTWLLDGQSYPRQRELHLPQGVDRAVYRVLDLPQTGQLQCQMRSYYTDREIFSPKLASNILDLSAILGL